MPMLSRALSLVALCALACSPAVLGQTDDFSKKLEAGCRTEEECDKLHVDARERVGRCRDNTIGYIRCSDARADLEAVADLRSQREMERIEQERAALQAKQDADEAEFQARREKQERERQAEREALDRRIQQSRDGDARARSSLKEMREAREARGSTFALVAANLRPALSLMLCETRERIAANEKDLAREKQIEARGGVQDLSERRRLAEALQADNEQAASLRSALPGAPLPCSGPWRQELESCAAALRDWAPDVAATDRIRSGESTHLAEFDQFRSGACSSAVGDQAEILVTGVLTGEGM